MRLCSSESCGGLFGFWAWVPFLIPISTDGEFAFFCCPEESWYPVNLWYWLVGPPDEEDDEG